MANPKILFLERPQSLADQVAEALLEGIPSGPFDLSQTEVWVPTSGAARRIRHSLAKISETRGSGVLSPRFSSPMKALLPSAVALASRTDREAAWGLVLQKAPRDSIEHLFPRNEVLEGEQALLGTAGMLCDLCDMLAEGGITPLLPRIQEVCDEDAERWAELAPLTKAYLAELQRHGLSDPNVARIDRIKSPANELKRLFIACIPDLSRIAEKRAESLMEQGIPVTALVWKPGTMGGGFENWGRPITSEWRESEISLLQDQIVMAKDPAEESSKAVDFLSGAMPRGSYSLVLGDPELGPAFKAELLQRGGSPFLPEGEPLSLTEPAIVASEWISLRRDRNLRTLRRLLETPRFAAWIGAQCGLSQKELLESCGEMMVELLAETMTQAAGCLESSKSRPQIGRLLKALDASFAKDSACVLTEAWSDDPAGVEAVLEACEESSPVFSSWPEPQKARDVALVRSLARGKKFGTSQEGDTDLSGWLEAPWAEGKRLALCGCVEGRLPASTDGHPFLPDQKRREFGIADNASRRARDAYFLTCLSNARPAEDFRASFSKFGPDGSPCVPSGLLMRCALEELAARVLVLFDKAEGSGTPLRREHSWPWHLPKPDDELITRISPTDFSSYLACPFRFYLERRLRAASYDPEAREMGAMQFGDLIHKVLERFGKESRGEGDRKVIEALVLSHLETESRERFGQDPSPAVRVQLESARVRLISFARVQAEEYAKGWRILESEYKIGADHPQVLSLAGLKLTAKIDRIEENGDLIRIIDYKSQGSLINPEKKHFGSPAAAFFKEGEVTFKGKPKAWTDLQLPLYRRIAETLYPGRPVETAYLVLAADPEQSGVKALELDTEQMESAMKCAEAVASRLVDGVFWPPRTLPSNWEDQFESLFLNGKPEHCIDEETVRYLEGKKEALS
jgi:hypothetical protein